MRIVAQLWLLSFLIPSDCLADSLSNSWKYATPDGSVLTLNRSGTNLTGTFSSPDRKILYNVEGSNSTPGKIELKIFDDHNSKIDEGTYSLNHDVFRQQNGVVSYSTWRREDGDGNVSPFFREFSSVISAENKRISEEVFRDPSVAANIYVEGRIRAQKYFQSQGIDYKLDSNSLFSEISNSQGQLLIKTARKDLSPLIARGWARNGELASAPVGAGLSIQTTGTNDAVASLNKGGMV